VVTQDIVDHGGDRYLQWHPSHGIDVNDAILAATVAATGGKVYTQNHKHSEGGNRIGRRPGASDNRQWRDHDKKLPSVPCRARFGKRVEVGIIEHMETQVNDAEVVDRASQLRGHHRLRMVGA
jgi:hypothetical protein